MRHAAAFLILFGWVLDALAQPGPPPSRCLSDDRYRQFDFWIGNWDVVNAEGQLMGTNSITVELGTCVLEESWTGAKGGTGKSLNYFDPKSGTWNQLWVNAFGGHTVYTGSFIDGSMRFEGTLVAPDGSTKLSRMTFTSLEDGRVRQYIEESTDGGTRWSAGFDGYYVKKDH